MRHTSLSQQFLDVPKGQCESGIEPDRVADDFWREAVALKRYRSHPMMLIGDEPQSYPSYRDIAPKMPEPVMRIAPKPRRWISISPPILNEPDLRASSFAIAMVLLT
jgi:hypothetical protein